jgi:hypothetical protein
MQNPGPEEADYHGEEPHVSAKTFSALMGAKAAIHDATIKRRLRHTLLKPPRDRDIKELITMLTCYAPRTFDKKNLQLVGSAMHIICFHRMVKFTAPNAHICSREF